MITDDPVIPFRVSHAMDIATIKAQVKDLSAWGKVGVSGALGLLAAILGVLLMRG